MLHIFINCHFEFFPLSCPVLLMVFSDKYKIQMGKTEPSQGNGYPNWLHTCGGLYK